MLFDMVGDPRAGHGLLGVSDPDVHLVDGRWTMFLGAFTTRFVVRIVEARLPDGAAVTDDRWAVVTGRRSRAALLGAPPTRGSWDRAGMHTPCYVVGETGGRRVERIYYAGRGTTQRTGPRSRYAIGVLERSGTGWTRCEEPVVTGDDERPSALEPRVVHDGDRWHLWYLATPGEVGRGEQPDFELRWRTSDDGLRWSAPQRFSSPEEGWFDNHVAPNPTGWRMLLARGTNLWGTEPYPGQGLWTARATAPGGRAAWSPVERLLDTDAVDVPAWCAAGVCGPSAVEDVAPDGRSRLHVFATGTRAPTTWWREATERVRRGRRPPPPSPYYLATGRLTFAPAAPSR